MTYDDKMLILQKLTSRKFLITLGCLIVSTILLVFAWITSEQYCYLITTTVVPYFGVNTYQKVKEAKLHSDTEEI